MIIKTGYSFRHAVGHIDRVVRRLSELGVQNVGISDRMSTFGYVPFTKAAEKSGIRVSYGVELPVSHNLSLKRGSGFLDYWTFFAKDSLRPLHDLIARATQSEALSYREVLELHPDVIKITGPASNLMEVKAIVESHGAEPPLIGLSLGTPRAIIRQAEANGWSFIQVQDNRYPNPDDFEMYRVTLGSLFSSSQTYPQHIMSDEEFTQRWNNLYAADALIKRDDVLKLSTAKLQKATLLKPNKPKTLRTLCLEGAERVGCDLSRPEYAARLDRELTLIAEKDFEDYFFIVADLMQFAREHMVVGPARGSSCGSLVCYLLGITSVDPIRFDLVFERFIDVTRTDLPDIDLDFSDAKRGLVFDYMKKTYGSDNVARLGSVNTFKAKAVLNQIGIALKIPRGVVNDLSHSIIKRSTGDARADQTINDTFTETEGGRKFIARYPNAIIAGQIEEHPSVAGQHAAGVVVVDGSVLDYVAVDKRTGATMCDKRDAEYLNLLKIDALGLTQLSVFERCLELIGKPPRTSELEKIPLDDQAAFDVLNQHKFSGIFQFVPGSALTKLVRQITSLGGRLSDLEDFASLTALVRPGPLRSGAATLWVDRRAGTKPVLYEHPALEPYLSKTLGLCVYQEQVLKIGRELGGLSWEDVTALRKAMSKSLGRAYFDQYGDKWKSGVLKTTGMSQETADKIWDGLCDYGSWAFNRSHSVAYGIVTYWCCWLKAHHPLEFAAATLDSLKDPHQQVTLLKELRDEGVGYIPVNPETSTDHWTIDRERNLLVGPLSVVKGIGPKLMQDILEARRTGSAVPAQGKRLLADPKTSIDILTPIANAIEKIDRKESNITSELTALDDMETLPLEESYKGRKQRRITTIAMVTRFDRIDENRPESVSKRGYAYENGPTESINMILRDDTQEVFCKIGRYQFKNLSKKFLDNVKAGSSLFGINGYIPEGFAMIFADNIKYIGELGDILASERWVTPKTPIKGKEHDGTG